MTHGRKRRRRNRDPKEMRAALARRQREGLSWSRLAEVTGIPLSTLQWWQKKLREDDGADTSSDFVELLVRDDVESNVIESFEVVLLCGAVVRVPQRFDAASLAELLEIMDARSC